MDIRMASDYLGISPDTLYKYASDGFVPAFKLGNRWRFKRSRLDEWMDQQSSQGAQPRKAEPHSGCRAAQKTAIGGSTQRERSGAAKLMPPPTRRSQIRANQPAFPQSLKSSGDGF